jgi:small GTP-binding protein
MAEGSSEPVDHLFKVLVVGEPGTGKTSIIKRFVHNIFTVHYKATIGVDFALKVLNWDDNTIVRLQLWDIAGQERFGNMTRVYYKEAVGAMVVFDITSPKTWDEVAKWKQDIDLKVRIGDDPIPVVLLANKVDLDRSAEGFEENNKDTIDAYCQQHGFAGWFATSAKSNQGIDKAARFLVERMLKNDARQAKKGPDADVIDVSAPGAQKPAPAASGGCC